MQRNRTRDGLLKVRRSIRMPKPLYERIQVLATKSLITSNAWIVKALARGAKWKGEKPDD